MAFTREALFLKWSSGATKKAFKVLRVDYRGGIETKPANYTRSQYDGSLLIIRGIVTPRRFAGTILGEDSPSGTANDGVEDIDYGSIADLKLAWAATDLQAKSFEDSAYWDAEWIGDWDPPVDFGPNRNYSSILVSLEER